jgi:hypothetical protein
MTLTALAQLTEADQLKQAFVKTMIVEAKEVPSNPTRQQIEHFALIPTS